MSIISCDALFRKSPLGYWEPVRELLIEIGCGNDEAIECICEFRDDDGSCKEFDISAISICFELCCSMENSFWVLSRSCLNQWLYVWEGVRSGPWGEAHTMCASEGILWIDRGWIQCFWKRECFLSRWEWELRVCKRGTRGSKVVLVTATLSDVSSAMQISNNPSSQKIEIRNMDW